MPKIAIDYSKCVIYKLVCKDINVTDVYIGHTTQFTKRKYQHKSNSHNIDNKLYHLPVYAFIREHGGFDNWDMVLIENYSCSNQLEALRRERYYLELLQATLNSRIPSRTNEEYGSIYRAEHREQILETKKEKKTCCCGIIYSVSGKSRHVKSQFHLNFINNQCNNDIVEP